MGRSIAKQSQRNGILIENFENDAQETVLMHIYTTEQYLLKINVRATEIAASFRLGSFVANLTASKVTRR